MNRQISEPSVSQNACRADLGLGIGSGGTKSNLARYSSFSVTSGTGSGTTGITNSNGNATGTGSRIERSTSLRRGRFTRTLFGNDQSSGGDEISPTSVRNVINPFRTILGLPMISLKENFGTDDEDESNHNAKLQTIKTEPLLTKTSTPDPSIQKEHSNSEPPISKIGSSLLSQYIKQPETIAEENRPNEQFQVPFATSNTSNKTKSLAKPKKKSSNSGWKFDAIHVAEKEYLIMEQIGKGGGGIVNKIKEKETRKDYALKTVNLGALDDKSIQECIHEINMLRELKGTGFVIQIEDWEHNVLSKEIKIVMEIGEIDLHHYIYSRKLSKNEVTYLWERMLLIVEFIHSKGIVHSDLKPANFLFVKATLKLIDFGISNKIQNDATSIGLTAVKGTLNFISPETLNQDAFGKTKTGPKSDIWALGCILHLMVFGFTPFQHIKNDAAKMCSIIKGVQEYPPLPEGFQSTSILDVLSQCFRTNSRERPTATILLQHPFLK